MSKQTELLAHLYERFNAKDLEGALATMQPSVVWANGLEGGHVIGHAGVREYWTQQWAAMDSRADRIHTAVQDNGTVHVDVHLTARDLSGRLLFDSSARHVFEFENGLISRFDIA